jgi:hypothetical protein
VQSSTVQLVFFVEHYFRAQSYEAEVVYQVHVPDATVPNNLTIFQFVNNFRETGSVH